MNSLTSSLLLSVLAVKFRMAIDRISPCYAGFIRDKHMDLGIYLMKYLCTVRIKIHNLKVILISFYFINYSSYHWWYVSQLIFPTSTSSITHCNLISALSTPLKRSLNKGLQSVKVPSSFNLQSLQLFSNISQCWPPSYLLIPSFPLDFKILHYHGSHSLSWLPLH